MTTSKASAKATSRSAGRGAQAADKGETRPVRADRPNCRSRRRPNRRPGSFGQRVTVERVEGAASGLGVAGAVDGGRGDGVAEGGLLRLRRGRIATDDGAELRRLLVIDFRRLDRLVGDAAPGFVVFEEFHDRRFRGVEAAHQRANLLAFGLALARLANGHPLLLRVAAKLKEIVALRRGLRPRSAV